MAEITRKRQGELIRGVFSLLISAPEGMPAKEVLAKLEQVVPPTDFENSEYPNRPGLRRYEKIVRFSTIPAVKAGWLVKKKGVWQLSAEGVQAFSDIPEPETFFKETIRRYRQWKAEQPESGELDDAQAPSALSTLEEAEESAWAEVAEHLGTMNPYDFQDLVGALLEAMGYHIAWIAPQGPDKGVDIIAYVDPLGTSAPRIKVQVKRRADKIAVDGLRSFMATLSDQDVGIFISLGGFTSEAESEARQQESRRVTLISMEKLFDLWVEHYADVAEEKQQLFPLRPIYFLDPRT